MKDKKSYGIMFAKRYPDKGICFLMIQRPVTYDFYDLIIKIQTYDPATVIYKMNKLTFEEKMLLTREDFEACWKKIFKNSISDYQFPLLEHTFKKYIRERFVYVNKRTNETIRGSEGFKYALSVTKVANPKWMFPAGRSNREEKPINTAIREFEEETGIKSENIIMHTNFIYAHNIHDENINYQMKYYLASQKHNFVHRHKYSLPIDNIVEVVNIEFLSLEEIKQYSPELFKSCQKARNYINNNSLL